MNWTPTEKEIRAVVALPGPKRYEYWIKKVADQQQLWSLWKGEWALAGDNLGHELVPVWPHPKYAALCATEQWANNVPKVIELKAWFERWIPGIEKDARLIAIFPTPTEKGTLVDPRRLESDLREELSQYE